MSLDATIWAWSSRTGKATDKLVLLSLADRAGDTCEAYPSQRRLAFDTELNRKTIAVALDRLENAGLIEDTGKRRGATNSVVVWRLVGVHVQNWIGPGANSPPESGGAPKNGDAPNYRQRSPVLAKKRPRLRGTESNTETIYETNAQGRVRKDDPVVGVIPSRAEIERHARPGETWEEARNRLIQRRDATRRRRNGGG